MMNTHGPDRTQFLTLTAWFMSAMALLAGVLSWISETQPLSLINPSWQNLGTGILAGGTMLSVLQFAKPERRLVMQLIGAPLAACRWYELLVLAAVVGFCEEWLFRGVLELWLARWHAWGAVIVVNIVFGLLHAMTLRYFILACSLGFIMSLLLRFPGEASLLRPMVAHGVYDFLAFLLIARDYRRQSPV